LGDGERQSAAELLEKLQEMDKDRASLLQRGAVISSKIADADRELAVIKSRMQELGTSPETIDTDVANAEATINQGIGEYQQNLNAYRRSIEEAEAQLK